MRRDVTDRDPTRPVTSASGADDEERATFSEPSKTPTRSCGDSRDARRQVLGA
jgi:hypothetical protein